jgi:flagellar biosynthesis protein FliR
MDPNELLLRFSTDEVAAFFLVLGRISPLFLLAPMFSSKSIPGRVKGIVAVALAVGLTPIVRHGHIDMDPLGYGALMLKEIIVGLAFSYALGAMFSALAVAGGLLDTLIGFSFGAMIDPITGNQSTVISQMYSLFGVMIFIAVDGDSWVVKGLARTYDAVPLLQSPAIGSLTHGAEVAFSGVFLAAVMIAAPVLIAVTIVDAAFGVVSKVVPQMNIFAVGFPAKMLVGLTLIGATLPFVSGFVATQLQESVRLALEFLKVA